MSASPSSPVGHFQRFFLRGLAVVLPATLTLWVLVQAYLWIDRSIAEPINRSIRYSIVQLYGYWPTLGEFTGVLPTPDELIELRMEAGLPADDSAEDSELIFAFQEAVVNSWTRS